MARPDIMMTRSRTIRALSFRVLCHAEFETYFEERSLEIARVAKAAWDDRRHVSVSILCMIGFSGFQLDSLPATLAAPPNKKQTDWNKRIKIDNRLASSFSSYHHRILNLNHGVREENLITMLLPLGFDTDKLDPFLVIELNKFSSHRGQAAHQSSRNHVERAINPQDEYNSVRDLLKLIEPVDEELDRLLKAAG